MLTLMALLIQLINAHYNLKNTINSKMMMVVQMYLHLEIKDYQTMTVME